MKKIFSTILATALIIFFVTNYNKNNVDAEVKKEKYEVNDYENDNDISYSQKNIEDNSTSEIDENNPIPSGVTYIKNNDYSNISDEDKNYMYDTCINYMDKFGIDKDQFTYEDMREIYDMCRNYILENNVDPDNLSLKDKAKLYSMCEKYLKNSKNCMGK